MVRSQTPQFTGAVANRDVRDWAVSESFRIALVGAGRMGCTPARALVASGPVQIAAVVEPSDEAAARVPGVPRHRSIDELVAAGGVDGALVAVPTRLHVPAVSTLL